MTCELKNIKSVEDFSTTLKIEIELLEKNYLCNKVELTEKYDKDEHWRKMDLCCELISKECTKLAVAFSKPPFPSQKDSTLLLQGIATSVDMLLSWYKCFPINEGLLLNRLLENCILGVLTSVATLTDFTLNGSGKSQLTTSTGSVWENCKNFKKIPKENLTVALQQINSSYMLISDAIAEIEQSILEFDQNQLDDIDDDLGYEDDEKWTEKEKSMMKPLIGLLMAAKGLLKKLKVSLKTVETNSNNNKEVDQLMCDHINNISPFVDDLVAMVYPPLNQEDIQNQTNKLSHLLKTTLMFIQKSFIGSITENHQWIEFVQKAVDHNLNNLMKHLNS